MVEVLNGKYELVEVAGEGGMAKVYRAYTLGTDGFRRAVAIKRIHDDLTENEEFLEMFVEEARVSAHLHHPNVVQIHDFERDQDGAYFLVMEWVPGVNLLEWSDAYRERDERPPWYLVAAIGIEILNALGSAHEHRLEDGTLSPIYHRDVTPQNILVSERGYVKLTDFGLARASDRARITEPHIVKGKVSYLAPELTEGAEPSIQSDIFGMGVLLWEALMGRKLFDGEGPVDVVRSIRATMVPNICEEREEIPQALMDVAARALARDPADRYRSTRTMARALANILRVTPQSTGANVLAETVIAAKATLAECEDAKPDDPEAFPLTRRKG